MNVNLQPAQAIEFLNEADEEGIPYTFVRAGNKYVDRHLVQLVHKPDWGHEGLVIRLHPEGTWDAVLNGVPSPKGSS